MLYLNPPYYVIDGVSVFPDHADPLQFYYLPMMPHLSTSRDASGAVLPVIQLIEYEGSAGTGGFINFDVNIGIEDQAIKTVASKLRQQAQLADMPRLSPVTFTDGGVRLLILGAQSSDPAAKPQAAAAAAPATGPRFVIKVQNAAKPSLFGDNQASFSVQLDQYGATILAQALRGDMAPIAVIYDLDFVALRPAFKVQLHVDWDRVQSYLDSQFSGGFLFVSDQIDKAVESLIESQAITINIDSFVTEDDPAAHGTDADRDRAVSECYDMIKSTFFQASLPPPDPNQPDGWDKAAGAFRSVSAIAMGGPAASMASFSYKQTDLKRTDRKRLDVTMTERTAVLRTIYPQGHLSGLLAAVQSAGVSFDRFITRVNLDDPWFQRRTLRVVTHADFAADAIASIDVNLTYGGNVQSVTLNAAGSPVSLDWSSVLKDGHVDRPVSYTYTVNFHGVDSAQRPTQLTSPAMSEIGDVLSIEPRALLYDTTTIPLTSQGLPWDRYPSVQVDCRYIDADNAINLQISATLTSAMPALDWPLFLRNPARRAFDYRLTYAMVAGGTHETPWTTTDAGKVAVSDPFPAKMALTILPALDWMQTDQALVFLAYPTRDAPTSQQTIIFTKGMAAQTFIVEKQSPAQTLIYYEVRLIKKNGSVWSVPGSFTAERLLIVQDGMKGHQIVQVAPEQVDFAKNHVASIDVLMRYIDTAHTLSTQGSLSLTAASDTRSFAYDYVDAAISAEWRADVQLDNGQTKSSDWAPVGGAALTIPLSGLN